jgi:hypothetical protein
MALQKFNSVAGFSVGDTQVTVIDAGANVSALNVTATGDVSANAIIVTNSGNITGANVVSANIVLANVIGNASSVLFGDGANITGLPAGYANSDVANLLASGTLTTDIITSGTANVGNLVSTGSISTFGPGNISGGNLNVTGQVVATGNVSGDNITAGGNVSALGNVSGFDLTASRNVSATGNVSGGNITTTGNVDAIGGISAQGGFTGANVDVTGTVTGGNIATAGTVNATGTITGGNVATTGTMTADGNISGANFTTNGNVVAQGSITGSSVYANSGTVQAATVIAGEIGNASSILSGNGGNISGIAGANVTGTVLNATNAFVAQSANSVDGANVSGNVAFASVAFSVAGANVSGQVADAASADQATVAITAYSVDGGNVNGTVANANYAAFAGQVVDSTQANITSLGTLTSLVVSGNSEVQGNLITTNILGSNAGSGVTITATGTNQSITLAPSGSGVISANNAKITSLATPTAPADAATKQYVDDTAQGLSIRGSSQVATGANLPATYNNGTAGVGATLILDTVTTVIDGYTLVIGDRVLVKSQTNLPENGIYVVTQITGTTVLTRAADFDTPAEMTGGAYTFVQNGTVYNNTGWVQIDPVTTVGTSAIEFDQFSGAGTFTAGTGLVLDGTQFNIANTAVTAGTYGNASQTATFTVNAQGQITAASQQAITANAETLTGTSLNATVVGSSLTSVGTLNGLAVTGNANVSANVNASSVNASSVITAGAYVSAPTLSAQAGTNNGVNIGFTGIQANLIATATTSPTTLFVGQQYKAYEMLIKGWNTVNNDESLTKVLVTMQGDYIIYGQAITGASPGDIDVTATGNIVTLTVTPSAVDEINWSVQAYAV